LLTKVDLKKALQENGFPHQAAAFLYSESLA
jgi:hypothetical protein